MTYDFIVTGQFLFVFWFSVRNSELSGEPPPSHVTRAQGLCHVVTFAKHFSG